MRAASKIKLLCAALVPLAIATICLGPSNVEQAPGLTSREIVQIRHEVRKQVWHDVLPRWSLYSLKRLPSALCYACRAKITVVGLQPDGHVQADVVYQSYGTTLYGLRHESNRWVVAGFPLEIAPAPRASQAGR